MYIMPLGTALALVLAYITVIAYVLEFDIRNVVVIDQADGITEIIEKGWFRLLTYAQLQTMGFLRITPLARGVYEGRNEKCMNIAKGKESTFRVWAKTDRFRGPKPKPE